MNSTIWFGLAVFVSAIVIQSASGQDKSGDRTVDEKAIKAVFAKTNELENRTMNRKVLSITALAFVSALVIQPASGQQKGRDRTVDEEAIKAVLATYEETWNKHDMNAWGKLFTESSQPIQSKRT